jgi:translation initiation factor IF-3
MELIGKIKIVGSEQQIGTQGFKKRELVVTTEDQYPQTILVEFVQDKCDLLNNFAVNDNVKVSINLRGREWINPQGEAKYFNSLHGWKIEKV